ncbi:hypothetical protein SAMN05443248_4532 [Bradyrhizobium erythrophlei]|jgi:hypothetical protein|uniref:Uncharacterized protein n=1 Tax=Bradyrhizobium erythrophlei TaxID=1437360 RepID=A0A1M5SA32_9BRAD|nr:hypothetical protein SAMN05443248_4532 [Bradyrhizobium erythrophlei]
MMTCESGIESSDAIELNSASAHWHTRGTTRQVSGFLTKP